MSPHNTIDIGVSEFDCNVRDQLSNDVFGISRRIVGPHRSRLHYMGTVRAYLCVKKPGQQKGEPNRRHHGDGAPEMSANGLVFP